MRGNKVRITHSSLKGNNVKRKWLFLHRKSVETAPKKGVSGSWNRSSGPLPPIHYKTFEIMTTKANES